MKKINLCLLLMMAMSSSQLFAQRSLTVTESQHLALQNNAKSKNSRLEMAAARQIRKSAITNYFPSISGGGLSFSARKNLMEMTTPGGNLPVYDGNPANLRNATQFAYFPGSTMGLLEKGTFGFVNAVQPVFAGGRIINGNKLAALGEDVSALKSQITHDEIRLKTEEQYWQLVTLAEKQRTLDHYETLLNRLHAQVQDAFNSGVVMKNDVLKVKLKLSETLLNKSKLKNKKNHAARGFCQYLGIPYDSTLVLGDTLAVAASPQLYHADNEAALKNRTEYHLLQAAVRAEELQTKMKRGEYLPQAGVGVGGLYMQFDDGESRTLGLVFGTVSIPLSGWWEASHTLQERHLQEEIAQNNFRDKSEVLLLQMEKTWEDVDDAYKQVLLSEEAQAQAEENLKVNQDGYDNGMISVADLLEAQALAQQARDQTVEAKANYRIKVVNYLIQTGRYSR